MNLYTSTPHRERREPININERPVPKVKSQVLYLASLSRGDDNLPPRYNLVTTIQKHNQKLYVLQHGTTFYLSDEFLADDGIANILFSSHSLRRATKYGNQLVGNQ